MQIYFVHNRVSDFSCYILLMIDNNTSSRKKDGKELKDTSSTSSGDTYVSELKFDSLLESNSSTYTCCYAVGRKELDSTSSELTVVGMLLQ